MLDKILKIKFILVIFLFSMTIDLFANQRDFSSQNETRKIHLVFFKLSGNPIHIHAEFNSSPKVNDRKLILKLFPYDENHNPILLNHNPFVKLWMKMNGHEHGSRPTVVTKKQVKVNEENIEYFEVSSLFFTMQGEWQVHVTIKLDEEMTETQSFNVKVL